MIIVLDSTACLRPGLALTSKAGRPYQDKPKLLPALTIQILPSLQSEIQDTAGAHCQWDGYCYKFFVESYASLAFCSDVVQVSAWSQAVFAASSACMQTLAAQAWVIIDHSASSFAWVTVVEQLEPCQGPSESFAQGGFRWNTYSALLICTYQWHSSGLNSTSLFTHPAP